jgi:hypothetical protein
LVNSVRGKLEASLIEIAVAGLEFS